MSNAEMLTLCEELYIFDINVIDTLILDQKAPKFKKIDVKTPKLVY